MTSTRAARWLVIVSATTACLLVPITAQQAPVYDLRGVWKLISITDAGHEVPMNALMFLGRTYYGRITVEKDRPRFPKGVDFRRPETLTQDQQHFVALLFPRSNSNGGTYRVVGDTFFFTAIAHQNPNAEGQEFRRKIERNGDRLRLIQEGDRRADEVWERVEDFK